MEVIATSILDILINSTLAVYGLSLFLIFIYSLTQLNMLRYFLKYQKTKPPLKTDQPATGWPKVTVELPLYNELYVVERLLECITA